MTPLDTFLRSVEESPYKNCDCSRCKPLHLLVKIVREQQGALSKISSVDHIGKDHAFDACNEIADKALTRIEALVKEQGPATRATGQLCEEV